MACGQGRLWLIESSTMSIHLFVVCLKLLEEAAWFDYCIWNYHLHRRWSWNYISIFI